MVGRLSGAKRIGEFCEPRTHRRRRRGSVEGGLECDNKLVVRPEVGEVLEREVDRVSQLAFVAQHTKLGMLAGAASHEGIVRPRPDATLMYH